MRVSVSDAVEVLVPVRDPVGTSPMVAVGSLEEVADTELVALRASEKVSVSVASELNVPEADDDAVRVSELAEDIVRDGEGELELNSVEDAELVITSEGDDDEEDDAVSEMADDAVIHDADGVSVMNDAVKEADPEFDAVAEAVDESDIVLVDSGTVLVIVEVWLAVGDIVAVAVAVMDETAVKLEELVDVTVIVTNDVTVFVAIEKVDVPEEDAVTEATADAVIWDAVGLCVVVNVTMALTLCEAELLCIAVAEAHSDILFENVEDTDGVEVADKEIDEVIVLALTVGETEFDTVAVVDIIALAEAARAVDDGRDDTLGEVDDDTESLGEVDTDGVLDEGGDRVTDLEARAETDEDTDADGDFEWVTELVEFGDTDGDADARGDADGEREARADSVAVDSAESDAETEGLDDVDNDSFGDEESEPVTEVVEVLREVTVPTAETVVLDD